MSKCGYLIVQVLSKPEMVLKIKTTHTRMAKFQPRTFVTVSIFARIDKVE